MKKKFLAGLVIGLMCLASGQAQALSILASNSTWNGQINYLNFGSSEYSNMNALVENGGENHIDFIPDLEDLSIMLTYDVLWVNTRGVTSYGPSFSYGGSLTSSEIDNIEGFIATGRKVVLQGEWGGWLYDSSVGWEDWDNQILSIVGGSYDTSYGDSPVAVNPQSILSHELTQGVSELGLIGNRYGTAYGGTSLFNLNIATLWGDDQNVLTVLDSSVFSDISWNKGDNAIFAQNVALWVTTEPVPEPATMLLMGTGIVGLVGSRLRRKKK